MVWLSLVLEMCCALESPRKLLKVPMPDQSSHLIWPLPNLFLASCSGTHQAPSCLRAFALSGYLCQDFFPPGFYTWT